MNNPKKIAEKRFSNARELMDALYAITPYAFARSLAYVKLFSDNDGAHASVVRLWEDTLTDGSKVYEVHIQ